MIKKTIVMFLTLALLGTAFAPLSLAQEMTYKKKTVIDFDEILLEGELKKPAGAYIKERQELKFNNLIRVRKNFEKEMFKSVDKLK